MFRLKYLCVFFNKCVDHCYAIQCNSCTHSYLYFHPYVTKRTFSTLVMHIFYLKDGKHVIGTWLATEDSWCRHHVIWIQAKHDRVCAFLASVLTERFIFQQSDVFTILQFGLVFAYFENMFRFFNLILQGNICISNQWIL